MRFDRITTTPGVLGGKPCIRGMRVSVSTVLGLLSAGHSKERVLQAYPYLEAEDIDQSLAYAAWLTGDRAEDEDDGPWYPIDPVSLATARAAHGPRPG